jgi:hypothetical protein
VYAVQGLTNIQLLVSLHTACLKTLQQSQSHSEMNVSCGTKEERKEQKKQHPHWHEIEFITVVVRDCITKDSKEIAFFVESHPESKDHFAIKKNKQNKNKKVNVSLLQTLSYFPT